MMKTNTGQAVLALERILNLVDTNITRQLAPSKPKTSGAGVSED